VIIVGPGASAKLGTFSGGVPMAADIRTLPHPRYPGKMHPHTSRKGHTWDDSAKQRTAQTQIRPCASRNALCCRERGVNQSILTARLYTRLQLAPPICCAFGVGFRHRAHDPVPGGTGRGDGAAARGAGTARVPVRGPGRALRRRPLRGDPGKGVYMRGVLPPGG
jgi:hypothetical protein